MNRRRPLFLAVLAGLCLPALLIGAPPTEEQIAAYTKRVQDAGKAPERDPGAPALTPE